MSTAADLAGSWRITPEALALAIRDVEALNIAGQIALCDEIFAEQPNLLSATLAATRMRPGAVESDLLLRLLMVCFRAMHRSGHRWALITEAEQQRQLARLTSAMGFGTGLPRDLKGLANEAFLASHPERMLLAYVLHELNGWLARADVRRAQLEADKFVMMSAINTVQCIAHGDTLESP